MRVLVVSGSSAFATIVETGGHQVTEARLGDAHAWRDAADIPSADVVLIDIPDFDLAADLHSNLSQVSPSPALVLIERTEGAWADHELEADVSLQPPLGRDTVLAAIDVAWSRRHPEEAPPIQVPDHEESPESASPAPDPSHLETSTATAAPRMVGVGEQAATLTRVSDAVATVGEVAATVTAAAAEALHAQAAALLCPDEEQWSVVGGYGTRSLELRVSLPPEHWLIEHLVAHRRGAIIDRTDIVRSELINAPLASRDHLVIVCDHSCNAVLMVGRDGDPFTQDDLRRAHSMLREASPYLLDGLALHKLASSLERFRELR